MILGTLNSTAQMGVPQETPGHADAVHANPTVGDLIPGSGGCRKVCWGREGMGKRGGARVIYFNGEDGRVWLLIVYAKEKFDNLPAEFLAKLKHEVERG
jgi:hypothetical protein